LTDLAPATLDEVSLQLPQGAYTTFRTYDCQRAFRLQQHFERLNQSARLANQPREIDHPRLRRALREILSGASTDLRIRITCDLTVEPGTIFVSIENLHIPSVRDYEEGVTALLCAMQRENPEAKLTGFIHTAAELRAHMPAGVNETLMVAEDGQILEGLSSNFFCIREGQLFTADSGVLKGITRSVVLDEAQKTGLTVRLNGVKVDELAKIEECFITSVSRDVLPVVQIADHAIRKAVPGPVSRLLLQRYRARIAAESVII
jgi:branched-chain amino acid aminotransferase